MKAIVYCKNGSPDVLQCVEQEMPSVGAGQVLLKVRAAGLNPIECGELKGLPAVARLLFGLRKPDVQHPARLGVDVAGEVEAVGANVTRFRVGDAVFGVCIDSPQASGVKTWVHHQGSFAEFVSVAELALVAKPANVSFEEAASAPIAALTALQGLRDKGHIQAGQNVLINGAAGGVGTFAVQLAKSFGAVVTAVCSARNAELVKSIGADHVLDYAREDFTVLTERYHLILDCIGNHSPRALGRVLHPSGICVMAGDKTGLGVGSILSRSLAGLARSRFTSQKFIPFLAQPKQSDLATIAGLMASGKVKPVIDRSFRLEEVPMAIRYLELGHARGKVVIVP